MRHVATLACAVVFFATGAAAQPVPINTPGQPVQPPRDSQVAQAGTAILRGRVFTADTGSPLRRAQVRLAAPDVREQRMTSTDEQGRYEFTELPAGRYSITASKGSYVTLSYGQQRPFESGKPLQVADGQIVERVDFSLPRGGVVTGHVVDEFGDPAANVSVQAMRYAFVQGRRQLTQAAGAQTNDIGEYRLFGLPPGQYYVSATLRTMGPMATTTDRSGYAPTYYPGTTSIAEAQRVTVTVAQTTSNVTLALIAIRTARISGTVVDADGRPAPEGFINVVQRSGTAVMGFSGAQIRPDGTFTISSVAPGEYTLQAMVGAGIGDPGRVAVANLTVAGEDIDGVRLAVARPATASGVVVLEGAMPNAAIRGSQFRVNATPAAPEPMFGQAGGGGAANDDLTFQLRVRPCVCVVRAFGAPTGWHLKAVRLHGTDVTDSGIDFRADQEVDGIELVMTNQPTDLSGTVVDDKGNPTRDYTVIVFAQDRERWVPNSRFIAIGRPDQDGRYKIRALPAGSYHAIAVDYVEPGEWTDPEYLDRIRQNATAVSLGDGEAKTLDLKLAAGS